LVEGGCVVSVSLSSLSTAFDEHDGFGVIKSFHLSPTKGVISIHEYHCNLNITKSECMFRLALIAFVGIGLIASASYEYELANYSS